MPRPISMEIRERALAAYDAGKGSLAEVAELFGVSHPTLSRWRAAVLKRGTAEPLPRGGGNFSKLRIDLLEVLVSERPDSTGQELTNAYNKAVPKKEWVSRSAIQRGLSGAGYVHKKNGRDPQNRTGPMWLKSGASSKRK